MAKFIFAMMTTPLLLGIWYFVFLMVKDATHLGDWLFLVFAIPISASYTCDLYARLKQR